MKKVTVLLIILFSYVSGYGQDAKNIAGKFHPSISDTDVLVVDTNMSMPDSCKLLGPYQVGYNNYNLGCSYEEIVAFEKMLAHRTGGNVVKIAVCENPDFRCNCYKIRGNVYYRKNLWNTQICKTEDSLVKVKFGDPPKFAILYVYRIKKLQGEVVGYDIHLGNDSVICRVTNNSAYMIKLYKEGQVKIWARTAAKSKIYINVKFGHEYYLKCGINTGAFIGEPSLDLFDKDCAEKDFNEVKKKFVPQPVQHSDDTDN